MCSGKVAAVSFSLNPFHLKNITSNFHNVLLQLVVMINGSAFSSDPLRGKKLKFTLRGWRRLK